MALEFVQEISVSRVGFGNSVLVSIGDPTPQAESYDSHPYIPAGSVARLIMVDGDGVTKTIYENAHESLSMWGTPGEQREFECEVGYDSTAQFKWTLDSVIFQEVDGEADVEAEMLEPATALFRMWGETESWGQGERVLFTPYSYKRDVDNH